jgi:replicative DNA helicase
MAEEQINSLVNLAAEQSLIGGVLILGFDADFRERTDYVFQNVRESDFYAASHRIIWREICAMTDKAKSVDVITLL